MNANKELREEGGEEKGNKVKKDEDRRERIRGG